MRVIAAVIALPLALAACITPPPVPGETREADVIARYGPPSDQWTLPDGSRVFMYADTPMGYGSTRITVDRDSVVRSVEPVINEAHFARLRPGMTKEDVRHELGRPGEVARYPLLNEDVWSWRYVEFGNRRMFFNAHFDANGYFKYASRTPEPRRPLRR